MLQQVRDMVCARIIPDLEIKSSAYKANNVLVLWEWVGHAKTSMYVYQDIEVIHGLSGKQKSKYAWISTCFSMAFMIGESLSQKKMCRHYLVYQTLPDFAMHVMYHLKTVTILIMSAHFCPWMSSIKNNLHDFENNTKAIV